VFCPVCESEYRDGFTKCSDCGGDLVDRLSEARPERQDLDTTDLLWSGDEEGTGELIAEALNDANIYYRDEKVIFGQYHDFGRPVFKLWINSRDHDRAHLALDAIVHQVEQADREMPGPDQYDIPESAATPEHDEENVQQYISSKFRPEDATAIVWSGSEPEMKEIVPIYFRENGIGCEIDDAGGKITIRVEPTAVSRAKEIIREIIEQTPPQ
jgi:hypothetical protein